MVIENYKGTNDSILVNKNDSNLIDNFSFDKDIVYKYLFQSYDYAKKNKKIKNEFSDFNHSHLFKIISNGFYKNPINQIKENIDYIKKELSFEKTNKFNLFFDEKYNNNDIFYKYCASLEKVLNVGDNCAFLIGFNNQKFLNSYSLEVLGLNSYKKASNISAKIYDNKNYKDFFEQFKFTKDNDLNFFFNYEKLFKDYITVLNYFSEHIKNLKILEDDLKDLKNNLPAIVNVKKKKKELKKDYQIGKKETDEGYDECKFLSDLERTVILTTLNPKILSKNIKEKVIGQNDAVNNVIDSIVMMGVGLIDQNIPLNFYTAGPTGVGKNYLFEILSDELSKMFNTNVHYKEINCSSLKNEGAINQLIGSNKGYIGSEKDSLLYKFYNKAKNCPFSVLLFDEFEKSHNNLIDFLLPILDKGKIYDNKENYLDFSGSLITFTSNIGYSNLRGNKRKNLGFSKNSIDDETDARKEYILGEINKKFTPEFLNRLNIVHFNYLNNDSIDKIFDLEFNKIRKRLENKHDVLIKYDKKLKNKIIENGFSKEYGARNIKNILNKNVAIPLAKHLHNDIKIDSKKSMEMIEYLNNLKKKINEDENNSFSRENVLKNVTGFINKNLDFSKILIKYNKNDELEFVKS